MVSSRSCAALAYALIEPLLKIETGANAATTAGKCKIREDGGEEDGQA
jgi:hypothetical protein